MEIRARPKIKEETIWGAVLAFVAGTAVGIVVMCLIQIKR